MTIYEVAYIDDGAPGGYARLFFTSRRAAARAAREIQDNYLEMEGAFNAALAAGVGHYDMPVSPGETPYPEIAKLTFSGPCREMVLQALRHAR